MQYRPETELLHKENTENMDESEAINMNMNNDFENCILHFFF